MRKEFPPQKTLISDSTIHRRPSFFGVQRLIMSVAVRINQKSIT